MSKQPTTDDHKKELSMTVLPIIGVSVVVVWVEIMNDRFCWSVALSDNGNIVASGGRFNARGGSDAGHVRVYEYDKATNQWFQLGQDLKGETTDGYLRLGSRVALSADGSIIAAGTDDRLHGSVPVQPTR